MLNFTYATMGAGKSAVLIAKATSTNHCVVLKPGKDTRFEGSVWSRNGQALKCDFVINDETDIWEEIKAIGKENIKYIYIDEAQFLSEKLVEQLLDISLNKKVVIEAFGLLNNFQSYLFDGSKRLIELADNIQNLPSYDSIGLPTKQTARFVDGVHVFDGPEVFIGKEEYTAMSNKQYFANKKEKK